MHFLKRCVAAIAVLALSSMPAWPKPQQVILRGHTYSFDVPEGFQVDMTTGSSPSKVGFADEHHDLVVEFTENDDNRPDLDVGDSKPVEHRGTVTIARSKPDYPIHQMAASTQACNNRCFVTASVMAISNSRKSESDALFEGYIRGLASRSFETSGAAASGNAAEGHWLVIAGSWPPSQHEKVMARLNFLSKNGITANIIHTNEYPGLTPGLDAVGMGPTSRDAALTLLQTVQSVVPDAFIKESP
jgi:hypothetical protein